MSKDYEYMKTLARNVGQAIQYHEMHHTNAGRDKVTKDLKTLSAGMIDKDFDPYHQPNEADMQDAKYMTTLAKHNASGTLTYPQAETICEALGPETVIRTEGSQTWVEYV